MAADVTDQSFNSWNSLMRSLVLAVALLATSSPSIAGVTNIQAVRVECAGIPAGFYSYDLLIDFEGNLRGQQLVVELTSGSIYQDVFGYGFRPPSPALWPSFPSLECDTFITLGGHVNCSSEPILVVGGAPDLPGDAEMKFDEVGINIAWAPGTGVLVMPGDGYMIARLTISEDSNGTLHYFGTTSGPDDPLIATPGGNFPVGTITQGILRFGPIPEPSTALLASLALASVAARRQ